MGTGLDRWPALACHVVFALMVVAAYRRGRRWWFAAIAAHAALDLAMFTLRDLAPQPIFVGAWLVAGIAAVLIIVRVLRPERRSGLRVDQGGRTTVVHD